MATVPLIITQSGYEDVGDVWTNIGPIAVLGLYTGFLCGARFDVATKGVLYTALELSLSKWPQSLNVGGVGTLSIYAVQQNSAAVFTTGSALPRYRHKQLVQTVTGNISDGNSITTSIPLNDPLTGVAFASRRMLHFGADPNVFGLILSWVGPDIEAAVTLTATYQEAFTGLSGPDRALGRADECPKCGGKSTRDTWVRDRFSDKMVCPRCYDPQSFEDVDARRGARSGREREGVNEG